MHRGRAGDVRQQPGGGGQDRATGRHRPRLAGRVAAEGLTGAAFDAAFMATETMTTVGYGDKFPLSSEGRLIAALLMMAAVGLVGTFSGFVAAWFLESPKRQSAELEAIQRLAQEVNELREQVRYLGRS